jgi:hypothetical protein
VGEEHLLKRIGSPEPPGRVIVQPENLQPSFVAEGFREVEERELPQHFVYEDDGVVAFLNAYPKAYGYTLVASKEHRQQVSGDFTMEEYLDLQQLVYRVSEAVREEVGAERMYIYTFGSMPDTSFGLHSPTVVYAHCLAPTTPSEGSDAASCVKRVSTHRPTVGKDAFGGICI